MLFCLDPKKTFHSHICLFPTCLPASVFLEHPLYVHSFTFAVSFPLPKMTFSSFAGWKIPTRPSKPSSNAASSSKTSWIVSLLVIILTYYVCKKLNFALVLKDILGRKKF